MNPVSKDSINDIPLVIFDGYCNLCNTFVRLIIRLDSEKKLLFTTSDSTHVRPLLEKSNIDATADETVLFGLHGKIYEKSDAVIEILKHLNRPYYYLGYIKFLPKGLRDAIYEIIASNRYRIFGKRKECMIPDRSIKERFI